MAGAFVTVSVFYINRDGDAGRRLHIEQEFTRLGIEAVRVPGVEGRSVPVWLEPYYDANLTSGEVGCSASHLTIYAIIRDMGLPYAVVLEDDARLSDNFLGIAEDAIKAAPLNWDIIRLCRRPSRGFETVRRTGSGHDVIRYSVIPYGTAALIVSASGAEKLLRPRIIKDAIDHEVRQPWHLDLNVFGIDPPIATEVDRSIFPSTIQTRMRPRKRQRLARMFFNIRQMGLLGYARCFIR